MPGEHSLLGSDPGPPYGWIGAIAPTDAESTWLAGLRCPSAVIAEPGLGGGGFAPARLRGSNWHLNGYLLGRAASDIRDSATGCLSLEVGIWDRVSRDTGILEIPSSPWAYPHPRVRLEFPTAGSVPWDWLPAAGARPSRNVLWCDGHVSPHMAATWPLGDQAFDQSRIYHMQFGLIP